MPSIKSVLSLDNYNPSSLGRVTHTACPAVKAMAQRELALTKRSIELLDFEVKKFEVQGTKDDSDVYYAIARHGDLKVGDRVRIRKGQATPSIYEHAKGTVVKILDAVGAVGVQFDEPWGQPRIITCPCHLRTTRFEVEKRRSEQLKKTEIDVSKLPPLTEERAFVGQRVMLIDGTYWARKLNVGHLGTIKAIDGPFASVVWDGVNNITSAYLYRLTPAL